MARAIDEEWLVDHDPDEAHRLVAAAVAQLRDHTLASPAPRVLVVTHRYVTTPVAVVSALLVIPTGGLSVIPFFFAKSTLRCTIRFEPDGDGARLVLLGHAHPRTIRAAQQGLGIEESA